MAVKKVKHKNTATKSVHNSVHKGKQKPTKSISSEVIKKKKQMINNKTTVISLQKKNSTGGVKLNGKGKKILNKTETQGKQLSKGIASNSKEMDNKKQNLKGKSEKWKEIKRKKKNKKAKLLNNKEKVNVNLTKLEGLLDLEKKGKIKKPLTDRQKHKLMKLKLKREEKKKAFKAIKKLSDNKKAKDESKKPQDEDKEQKVEVPVPKGPKEISSNWKKFQMESSSQKSNFKRKISPDKIINPKYRKLTDKKKPGPQINKKPDIWFDDVDDFLLEGVTDNKPDADVESNDEKEESNPLVKKDSFKGLTKAVAMDCEMVGVGDGSESMVARVSMVNQHGEPIYDKYVTPKENVKDYRTHVSGIRPGDLEKGEDLEKVQKDVAEILKGRILVGHAIRNDLQVLFLEHPRKNIRDTSRYKDFRRLFQGRTPSLKNLTASLLQVKVQEGEHNSVQDAQAAMRLYTLVRKKWEASLKSRRIKGRKGKKGNG